MNSNQRSQDNNQSDNGGNELPVSSSRAGVAGGENLNRQPAAQGEHQPNDAAGGLPMSPGGANQMAADKKMDDDTGLSNTVNRPAPGGIDEGTRQEAQSNVGRRSDGTPD